MKRYLLIAMTSFVLAGTGSGLQAAGEQEKIHRMHEQMSQIHITADPDERKRLIVDHMQSMQEVMSIVNRRPMMGPGGMPGYRSGGMQGRQGGQSGMMGGMPGMMGMPGMGGSGSSGMGGMPGMMGMPGMGGSGSSGMGGMPGMMGMPGMGGQPNTMGGQPEINPLDVINQRLDMILMMMNQMLQHQAVVEKEAKQFLARQS